MYTLKLVYDPEPKTQTLKESITYCATVELYTQHQIECYQTSASELVFESDRSRLLALLYLSSSRSFTPKIPLNS
jgi:ribosomal protein L44E